MRKIWSLFLLLFVICTIAQDVDFTLGHPAYLMTEQEEIRSDQHFGSTVRPLSRASVHELFHGDVNAYLSKELRTYTNDSTRSERTLLKKLYQYPADLYFYQDEKLTLHANPILHIGYGRTNDALGSSFVYTRGGEIRGRIDDKVSFYTMLTENQARYPTYVNTIRDSTLVIPYEGFWKRYADTGVDFLRAQGYVDFGLSKSISAQFGFGKHFVGQGMRSLILSDYANNYPYLRINTKTKIFDYTNVFAEMIAEVRGSASGTFGTGGFGKKYLAFHHLNVKVKPNFHIGLFESVVYGDSTGGLKLEYLNPIIFYRAVEQQNGSEDNAMVGLDFKWIIKNKVSLYGQLVIDELRVQDAFAGNGWWGNKQGFQLGAKYLEPLGIDQLMLQGEINRVRPYMYAHDDGFTSYSHYNQAIAHPLGANFTEYLGRASYIINDRWSVECKALYATYGNDIGNENFGRDILKDYKVRRLNNNGRNIDFGNDHLQGNETSLLMLYTRVSYMLRHNFFLDLDMTLRQESDSQGLISTDDQMAGFTIRWNTPIRDYLF